MSPIESLRRVADSEPGTLVNATILVVVVVCTTVLVALGKVDESVMFAIFTGVLGYVTGVTSRRRPSGDGTGPGGN